MSTIEIKDLSKQYDGVNVLENITVSFDKGKIYGLVGRNGSGKTVLIKCIAGFIEPSKGKIFFSQDVKYSDFGVLIEHPGFLSDHSGIKNLMMLAMIRNRIPKERIKEVMKEVGLDPDNHKKVGKYSLGMKQRLGIAQAIMENQNIVILDEPTNGIDNDSVKKIRELIFTLKSEGKLVIIASHFKEDIEQLCDEVIGLDNGKICFHTYKDN